MLISRRTAAAVAVASSCLLVSESVPPAMPSIEYSEVSRSVNMCSGRKVRITRRNKYERNVPSVVEVSMTMRSYSRLWMLRCDESLAEERLDLRGNATATLLHSIEVASRIRAVCSVRGASKNTRIMEGWCRFSNSQRPRIQYSIPALYKFVVVF